MNMVPSRSTKGLLTISTVVMSFLVVVLSSMCLPYQFDMKDSHRSSLVVLCDYDRSGLLVGFVTEYDTSSSHTPVRENR